MAIKIDRTGDLLHSFVDLNNLALSRFSAADRARIGVHTCPGGDRDSTHSADVDYADLLPSLFELDVPAISTSRSQGKKTERGCCGHQEAHEAGSPRLRRRRRADRPARRDARRGSRPHARSGGVHSRRAARHDGRLRLLAVLRRHVDDARKSVREDQRASARHCTCGTSARSAEADGRPDNAPPEDVRRCALRSVALQNAQSILLARRAPKRIWCSAKQSLELPNRGACALARDDARYVGVDDRRHPRHRRPRAGSRASTAIRPRFGGLPAGSWSRAITATCSASSADRSRRRTIRGPRRRDLCHVAAGEHTTLLETRRRAGPSSGLDAHADRRRPQRAAESGASGKSRSASGWRRRCTTRRGCSRSCATHRQERSHPSWICKTRGPGRHGRRHAAQRRRSSARSSTTSSTIKASRFFCTPFPALHVRRSQNSACRATRPCSLHVTRQRARSASTTSRKDTPLRQDAAASRHAERSSARSQLPGGAGHLAARAK